MAGRDSKGNFRSDFNPYAWGGDFTEGCSLHYTWSVFHDPAGLSTLMGGDANFIKTLDAIFTTPPVFDESAYGAVIHEMREMQVMDFGQYAHGNQPIQHAIYLYDWVKQPWKTQFWSREIMRRLYRPTPDGYCGDEDNGQTSAWYVFSALGFYPVCPVTGEYAVGSPLFRNIEVTMPSGEKMKISAQDNSYSNIYIQSLSIDGTTYNKNYFTTEQLHKAPQMNYRMGAKPNTERGVATEDAPYSFSLDKKYKK